ncbi:MAG: N-acetyltransferase family protein [Planctomycetota bacterium]
MTDTTTHIEYLSAKAHHDFVSLMSGSNCMCTAYLTDDYENKGRACREAMFARGQHDGYLLYVEGQVAGWCQCAPLSQGLRLPKDFLAEGVWGLTCMVMAPAFRGRGLATTFLKAILDDLPGRGCTRVIAVGHNPATYDDPSSFMELPDAVCIRVGMKILRTHAYGSYHVHEYSRGG